jgi:hypothetical protein
MAQHDYNIANQGFPAFRTDLNNALSAIQTTNSGTSRPTGAVAGQLWLDTTSATTPTLKYYDGADDISLATIDHSANTVNWLDSTVSITGLSTTATGTVLTLSDSASTSTVNLIIDNQKEIRFRETTANGTNYVALKAPASLSADLTFTLPTADGTNGQALITNGSGVLSFTTISAGTSWQSVKTSGFTAVSGEGYPCNTTSSAFTVTLPASPSVGSYVQIVDYAGTFATNNITLGANSNKIEGGTGNKILTTNREAVTLVYVDSTQGWVSSSGANEGTQSIDPTTYSVDFLVLAGGGGGGAGDGSGGGGGAGAGGYRTSTQTVNGGTVITVTVGNGGAGGTSPSSGNNAVAGSNSSISGSGLTTITSTGGGKGGGAPTTNGGSGGSGGGASYGPASGGAGNSPSTSPSQGNSGGDSGTVRGGGGGGGSSATGSAVASDGYASPGNNGGAGGIGTANSITGSSVTRGAGGGGGAQATGGAGGSSIGGAGGSGSGNGSNASPANRGSGGGGGGGSGAGGLGGSGSKGVVILSMLTTKYTGTTTGSPTVTTKNAGADTVLQFDGDGSYTA